MKKFHLLLMLLCAPTFILACDTATDPNDPNNGGVDNACTGGLCASSDILRASCQDILDTCLDGGGQEDDCIRAAQTSCNEGNP